MNKKTNKTKLTYTLLFSIVGMLSGCQMVDNFISDTQDTGRNYATPKRRANTAPTVIYDSGSTYTPRENISRPAESDGSSYSGSNVSNTEPGSRSMESSVPGIDMKSQGTKPKASSNAIVPTEAPAVPTMAPTFAP